MTSGGSLQRWRSPAAKRTRARSVEGQSAKLERAVDARKQIVAFLALTLVFTAISAGLAISVGLGGPTGDLIALGVMWSPGLAGLVTVLAFQRNLRGMGWGPGKPFYLLVGYGLPLLECSLVYGIVWLTGLGQLRGGFFGAAETLVAITPGIAIGALAALGEEIGWRGLLVP
jgi:uncharacterized protein